MGYNIGFPADGMDNQGWKLYITSLIMVIAAGLFVIWRCAIRFTTRNFGSDDFTMIASLIFSIVLSICINEAVVNGYGKHKADLPKSQLSLALEWFFIAQTPYKVTVCLYKISGVLFYKRIFITRSFQIACWVVIGILVAWGLGVIFATIFQCVPVAAAWDKTIPAKCIDSNEFWLGFAISDILLDALVLALPIPSILHLHLHIRERILLVGVFMLGGFVIVAGILRATSVANSLENRSDITYNFIPRGIWTLIDANVGIICACLPILKAPFSRMWSKMFGGNTTSRSGSKSNGYDSNELRRRREPSKPVKMSWLPGHGEHQSVNAPTDYDDELPVIPRLSNTDHSSKDSMMDDVEKSGSRSYYHETH